MALSKRMEAILSLVDHEYVADIGTDHGLIALEIIERGLADRVIATDISDRSLAKLRARLDPKQKRIQTLVSDGLTDLVGPFPDLAILAGMGSGLIIDILERDWDKAKAISSYIFQANSDVARLRSYLLDQGYKIEEELALYEEGYYYNIIYASHGKDRPYQPWELEYGRLLLEKRDPACLVKIKADLTRLEPIYRQLKEKGMDPARQVELEDQLRNIKEALSYYEA